MNAKIETPIHHSERTGIDWVPVIGLEVHCQLKTASKLFCGCAVEFGAAPNTRTCPVCSGQPGAMPVLNREALTLAVRAALALDCDVAPISKFDRKNYFYCDLPKGYQISQYDQPYCTGGGILLDNGRFVRLTRIHMEEDAGKAVHDRGDATLVDLNRACVPLIESVTEADITTAEEASEYLMRLREILIFSGVSDCDMEKGSLRCDVNISVHPKDEPWRTKVEIKNLNSFRHVRDTIEHEIPRQIEAYETAEDETRAVMQETRLWDVAANATRVMRTKENEADYRYFPEPDLPPVHVDQVIIADQRKLLPELPAARRQRYTGELGLSEYDAGVLTSSRCLSDFFEATVRLGGQPKATTNWLTNHLLGALSSDDVPASSIEEVLLKPHDLIELMNLVEQGTINANAGKKVIVEMLKQGLGAKELVDSLGLEQVRDEGQLETWCRAALEGKDQIIADVKAGKGKAIGALIGPVMQASRGSADPKAVQEILKKLIEEEF